MKQIKVKPKDVDINFRDVAEVADRLVWTGRLPTLSAICEELHVQSTDKVKQYFELWKTPSGSNGAEKTHIADLPSELKHLLAEAFERRVIALRAKLNAESAEIRVDRDRLAKINEQKDAQIEALMLALGDAEVKIADQARRISRLKIEMAVERNALAKAEQRIKDARQELTRAEHTLEDSPPDMCGGA
jgi:chromosome segregation ATPase